MFFGMLLECFSSVALEKIFIYIYWVTPPCISIRFHLNSDKIPHYEWPRVIFSYFCLQAFKRIGLLCNCSHINHTTHDSSITLETSAFESLSLRWPIHIINPVDKTKLSYYNPHRCSTSFFWNFPPPFICSQVVILHSLTFSFFLICKLHRHCTWWSLSNDILCFQYAAYISFVKISYHAIIII